MASNLFKHGAIDGEILIRSLEQAAGLEIICLDKGPGMADVRRMAEDGVSTAGTSGEGLGAIRRLSDESDIYSQKGVGTILLSRVYKASHKPRKLEKKKFEIGLVLVPKAGETDCGDGWAIRQAVDKCQLLAADGLGHGAFAQAATHQAIQTFLQHAHLNPVDIIRSMHHHIKRSRGVVGNVTTIDLNNQVLTYCGVGNIGGRVLTGPEFSKSVVSYNGIIGHNIPTSLHNHQVEWGNNSLLVLHSDGLKSKWDLSRFKDLYRCHSSIIAALIYKQFNRGTDDTLVLVARTRA
jgi:hypothetical protein